MDRMNISRRHALARLGASWLAQGTAAAGFQPRVELEEPIYDLVSPDNGAGPLWDYGAPGIVRYRDAVFAVALDTLAGVKPLHNCRWALYRRDNVRWQRVLADEKGRQREPCPIGVFSDGRRRELLVLHNNGNGSPQAHWVFLDRRGEWKNQGIIRYPIRGCYPRVALGHGVAHILAVGDIMEPVVEWRKWKLQYTGGRQWDYVFRRLFYLSNSRIATRQFDELVEVENVDQAAGHITNLDLWLAGDGSAHLVYLKRNVASRAIRDRFFPGVPITVSLVHVVVRGNQVAGRDTLFEAGEEAGAATPVYARFHAAPGGRLFVFAAVQSQPGTGQPHHENRLIEILPALRHASPVGVNVQHPFVTFVTATERGGSRPSNLLDVYGLCAGTPNTLRYARIRLA